MTQTATNPQTGERVQLLDGAWVPIKTATNPETGEKAEFVGGQWQPIDSEAPASNENKAARVARKQMLNNAFPVTKFLPDGVQEGLGSVGLGIVQGGTLGFGDEIAAGVSALSPNVTYKDSVENIRAVNTQAREDNPILFTGGEILGGGALGGAGASRVVAKQSLAATAKQGAKFGALGGGAYGAGTAEGGLRERAESGAIGALVGGAAGGALAPIAQFAGGLVSRVRNARPKERLGKADEILIREVMRQNKTDRGGAINLIKGVDTDDAALMFQKLGLQEFAEGASTLGGRSRELFETAVKEQQRGQQARISQGVKSIIGADDFTSLNNQIAETLRTEGSALYQQAFAQPFKTTAKMADLSQRPAFKSAMAQANKIAANKDLDLNANELQYFQLVKEGLDDMIGASLRQGKNKKASAFMDVQKELLSEMDAQVPEYAQARKLWAGQKANETALQYGRKALTMDAEDVAQEAARMSDSERQYMLAGILRGVDDRLRKASSTHNATTRFNAEGVRDVFRAVLPENQANRIVDLLENESLLTATGRRVRADLGSPTAPKQEAASRVARESRGGVRKVAGFVAEEGVNPIQSAKKYVRILSSEVTRQDPAVIEALAIRLAGTPKEAAEAFAKLSPPAQKKVQSIYTRAGGAGPFITGEASAIIADPSQ